MFGRERAPLNIAIIAFLVILTSCQNKSERVIKTAFEADWKVQYSESSKTIEANVPGYNLTDLFRNGEIEHPFKEFMNDGLEWISESEWTYSAEFMMNDSQLIYEHIDLIFEGVDTYSTIYLNGKEILKTENMFKQYETEVKPLLKLGLNELKVVLEPCLSAMEAAKQNSILGLPADNDQGEMKLSPYTRKAGYHFGWDFAPRMLKSGIWKPVKWRFHQNAYIESADFEHQLNDEQTNVSIQVRVQAEQDDQIQVRVKAGEQVLDHKTVKVRSGGQVVPLGFELDEVELWYPRGYGEQKLYPFKVEVLKGGQVIDELKRKYGFRSIALNQERDRIGDRFEFVVNGKRVFAKGVNMVPPAQGVEEKEEDAWLRCLNDIVEANMNMVRIWGGGVYPPDSFLDACDQHGVLVWQDFMFANSMVPENEEFLENVKEEVAQQAVRLRDHPSLALWCGNNEIDVAWKNWGWQQTYEISERDSMLMKRAYDQLFQVSIPSWLREQDANTDYIHTSPLSNWGNLEGLRNGDLHYWGVFHGDAQMEAYRENVGRFNSEYGMQSYPSERVLRMWVDSAQYLRSKSFWSSRQLSYKKDGPLLDMIEKRYWKPQGPTEFIELGHAIQKECLEEAILAHRAEKDNCFGTLYWQLNDVWPGASWSTVEYNGEWKPAHYGIRSAFATNALRTIQTEDSLLIQLISDSLMQSGSLRLKLFHYSGYEMHQETVRLSETGKVSRPLWHYFTKASLAKQILSIEYIDENGQPMVSKAHLFVEPGKFWQATPQFSIDRVALGSDNYEYRLSSDKPAWVVKLDCQGFEPDDQYFSLMPGEVKRLTVRSKIGDEHIGSVKAQVLESRRRFNKRDHSLFSGLRATQ